MSTPIHIDDQTTTPPFLVYLAHTEGDIAQCQKLQQMEQAEHSPFTSPASCIHLDQTEHDLDYHHLAIKLRQNGEIIATTSLRLNAEPFTYYAANRFNMESVLDLPGRIAEIGYPCVHPDYRNAQIVDTFWQGLSSVIALHGMDYLFSCVRVPTSDGGRYMQALMRYIRQHHYSGEDVRVHPKMALPKKKLPQSLDVVLPMGLKIYFSYGAVVCGEPYWDSRHDVGELFILLDRNTIKEPFKKHISEHL